MADQPFVTVIMPVRNEGSYITGSLGAVLAQDYPADRMEVLVADGMSVDDTRARIASLDNSRRPVRVVDNPRRIAPSAMNVAFAEARGEIIVRVDGHCEIAPDYVRRCVEHLGAGDADGVGGVLETVGETPLARSVAVAMSSPFGVGNSFRTLQGGTREVDTVAFPAYTRAIMEKAGPYDEELVRNQDDEYNYRLRKLGARILFAGDVRARYYSRSSLGSLARQYVQYGYWKVRVLQKHPRQMSLRQYVPPVFVAALLAGVLLAPWGPAGRYLLLVVAGAYLAANLLASLLTAAARGFRHLPRLPLLFAILHVAYGAGFLVGLVKFRGRWHTG